MKKYRRKFKKISAQYDRHYFKTNEKSVYLMRCERAKIQSN